MPKFCRYGIAFHILRAEMTMMNPKARSMIPKPKYDKSLFSQNSNINIRIIPNTMETALTPITWLRIRDFVNIRERLSRSEVAGLEVGNF